MSSTTIAVITFISFGILLVLALTIWFFLTNSHSWTSTEDILTEIDKFMRGPEWEKPTRELNWLVHVRLPELMRMQRHHNQHDLSITSFRPWGFMPVYSAEKDRIDRIQSFVRNLQTEIQKNGGFDDPLKVREDIAKLYAAHNN